MKKLILCLLFALLFLNVYTNEKTESVFSEDTEGYFVYELSFENQELTSLNFIDHFSNSKVISITPYISSLYEKRLSTLKEYRFLMHQSVAQNISRFERQYVDTLEQFGFRKEALKIRTNGIMIAKVTIYAEEIEITKIKQEFPKIHYKEMDRWI